MRNHYLPQLLLKGFREPKAGLWQFNIRTGDFERRNPRNAGQRRHFYSEELERSFLQCIDGKAGEIVDRGLVGRNGKILFQNADRTTLARWLSLFMMRTPTTFDRVIDFINDAKSDTPWAVDILHRRKIDVLAIVQAKSPEMYRNIITENGREDGEKIILRAYENLIQTGKIDYAPDPKNCFVNYINEARAVMFAQHLTKLNWVWLCSEYGFIIGDNPLCRWSTRKRKWNYGLKHRDIEVTIPLSSRVCLRMQRHQCNAKQAVYCDRRLTNEYNQRQALSAAYNLYGPYNALRPFAKHAVESALVTGKLAIPPEHLP